MAKSKKSPQERAADLRGLVDQILRADGTQDPSDHSPGVVAFARNGTHIGLYAAHASLYWQMFKRISALVDPRNDASWVEDAIMDMLTLAKVDRKRIDDLLLELVERAMTDPPLNEVVLPLYGLELEVPEVTIGDVRIMRPDVTVPMLEKGASDHMKSSEFFKQWEADFRNAPAACVPVFGNAKDTFERATATLDPVLDFLRFIGWSRNTMPVSAWPIGIGYWRSVGTIRNGELSGTRRAEPVVPFRLTQQTIDVLTQVGLMDFAETLKASATPTAFERSIHTSIHWLSNAEEQSRASTRLLSYVSALDGFFTERGVPIGRVVGEGVAFVLSDDPATRVRTFEFVDECYDARNSLSHGGRADVLKSDVETLGSLARQFVNRAIELRAQFETPAQFRAWAFKKRFGVD